MSFKVRATLHNKQGNIFNVYPPNVERAWDAIGAVLQQIRVSENVMPEVVMEQWTLLHLSVINQSTMK